MQSSDNQRKLSLEYFKEESTKIEEKMNKNKKVYINQNKKTFTCLNPQGNKLEVSKTYSLLNYQKEYDLQLATARHKAKQQLEYFKEPYDEKVAFKILNKQYCSEIWMNFKKIESEK